MLYWNRGLEEPVGRTCEWVNLVRVQEPQSLEGRKQVSLGLLCQPEQFPVKWWRSPGWLGLLLWAMPGRPKGHSAGAMGSPIQRSFSSLASSNPCLTGLAQGAKLSVFC